MMRDHLRRNDLDVRDTPIEFVDVLVAILAAVAVIWLGIAIGVIG